LCCYEIRTKEKTNHRDAEETGQEERVSASLSLRFLFQDAAFVPVAFNAGTYTYDGVSLPRVDAIAAKDTSG